MYLIVGGGIAGLSLALALQDRGADVQVVEREEIASGASGVATSYLEPRPGETPMRRIEKEALSRWEDYAARLEDETGGSVGFRREGQIKVSTTDTLERFERDIAERTELGWPIERLDRAEIAALEPILAHGPAAGVFLPYVRWVDGGRICASLAELITRRGGAIRTGARVVAIERGANCSVRLDDGTVIEAETIVLCMGLPGNDLTGRPDDMPRVRPVRGVNLVLDMSDRAKPVRHMVKHYRGNIVPRGGGRLLVGTTYENGEDSLIVGEDVVEKLYANAETIFPAVRDWPLLGVNAGLRTKTLDGNLSLARSKDDQRIAWSMGHAGSGFLQAPVLAPAFADYLLEGTRHALLDTLID